MLSNVAFLAVLMSGGFFAAAYSRKRFEEILPVSCMSIVLILFGFGLIRQLELGIAFIAVAVVCLYVISIVKLIQTGIRAFISRFFTPAFVTFGVIAVVLTLGDYGMMGSLTDEFSHWMDSVKAMVYINDFHANEAAAALFPSYPPAMALMQFLLQKINSFFNPAEIFSEWRMYFAYQVFLLSLFFPFLGNLRFHKPLEMVCAGILVLTIPLTFFSSVYHAILIDPFLGVLAGCGFAAVLLMDSKEPMKTVYVSLICAVLVLTKDAGMFFAAFIAAAFCFEHLYANVYRQTLKPVECVKRIGVAVSPAFGLAMAKILWKYVIWREKAYVAFDGDVELVEYTKMFFLQSDTTYKQTVVENFKNQFFSWSFYVGDTNIVISFFTLFLIFALLLYVLCAFMAERQNERSTSVKFTCCILFIQLTLYIYSLGATYVSNFDPVESVQLASYERYLSIVYLAVWIVLTLGLFAFSQRYFSEKNKRIAVLFLTVVVLIVSPSSMFSEFINRDSAKATQKERVKYIHLADQVTEYCNGNDTICFVSQAKSSYEQLLMKFSCRPNKMGGTPVALDFGQASAGNVFYATPQEWWEALLEEDFTHVAVFDADETFFDNYGSLFENPEQASEQTLYSINKELALLQKCQ